MAYARLTSYPPLNLLTTIPARQEIIPVIALLDWDESRPDFQFEVVLCYAASEDSSKHTSLWSTTSLTECKNPHAIENGHARHSTFQTTLLRSQVVVDQVLHLTYKYRVNPGANWQWAHSQQGESPAQLVFQSQDANLNDDLNGFMEISSGWKVSKVPIDGSNCGVFKLESQASIPRSGSTGDEVELTLTTLGKVKNQLQYFALVRMQPYWLEPRQGTLYFYLAEDAVLCSFLTGNGKVLTIITMAGIENTYSILQSNGQGQVVVAARCDSDKDVPFHALASIGDTFEESVAAVMVAARNIVNAQPHIQDFVKSIQGRISTGDKDSTHEDWLDRLAFCTWNSLGQDLTESKILSALDALSKNNINISTLLIDDNWQVLGAVEGYDYSGSDARGFSDLKVNSQVAPDGLPALVQRIRSSYPHIIDIGVWHALLGYWGGIAPGGQIAKDYETIRVPTLLMGNRPVDMTCIAASSLENFYNDFYTYLAQSGITFVKTDVQHMLSMFLSRSSRYVLIQAYQTAWTKSHLTHFQGKAISCMSQTPETLWSSLLQTYTPPVQLRNSDDFYPEVPASHPWHVWTNAHNALFTMHLNAVLDWDMFQTKHTYSAYHAAARCISGGPILITDTPGEHDIDLISQMTALDASGRSIALRPGPARTVRAFDDYMGGNVLKIGATTKTGCYLLGLWNIAEKDVSTFVSLSEFLGVDQLGEKVVVRSFCSGQVFGPFAVSRLGGDQGVGVESLIYTTVQVREWDILTMYPVTTVQVAGADVDIAVLGLTDKMSGVAGVLKSAIGVPKNGSIVIKLDLKALGKVGIWISVPSNIISPHPKSRLVGAQGTQELSQNFCTSITLDDARVNTSASVIVVDVESEWTQRNQFNSENKNIKLEVELITG